MANFLLKRVNPWKIGLLEHGKDGNTFIGINLNLTTNLLHSSKWKKYISKGCIRYLKSSTIRWQFSEEKRFEKIAIDSIKNSNMEWLA